MPEMTKVRFVLAVLDLKISTKFGQSYCCSLFADWHALARSSPR
jgi:hypothetical protein